jgi:hypothetical protein
MCIECLVYWRWLVYTAGNGFEIVNAEYIRVFATIPTYNIERMMTIPNGVEQAFLFDLNEEFALDIVGFEVLGFTYVALAERCMLQKLTILAEISLREGDRTERLDYKKSIVLVLKADLVDGATRNYYIIAVGEG